MQTEVPGSNDENKVYDPLTKMAHNVKATQQKANHKRDILDFAALKGENSNHICIYIQK